MTTAKTFYTDKELTRRSTAQLIAIYNRLFNTNVWDEYFNPFEHRMEIWMALWMEMRAQEVVALFTDADRGTGEKYKAMKINITPDGWIITWGKHHSTTRKSNAKVNESQKTLMRQLKADGETYRWIADVFGITDSAVFYILNKRGA